MTAKIAEYVYRACVLAEQLLIMASIPAICIIIGVVFFTSDTFKYMVDDWRYAEPACQYRAEPQGDGTYKLYRC